MRQESHFRGNYELYIWQNQPGNFIMKQYSEKQIKLLYQEFKMLKRYIDKLTFFDHHFGIIPFPFPSFDPALVCFFEEDKIQALTDIFKKERNNPALTEKRFLFNDNYRFNIKPANSNNAVYSTYILSKFLFLVPRFHTLINKMESRSSYKASSAKPLLDEANRIINFIEYKLQNEYDKSLRLHCMTVFYKGFYDAFICRVNLPDKKRKFIELYLYAQGMLYAKYLDALKEHYVRPLSNKADAKSILPSLLQRKICLLKEFGMIELFRKKNPNLENGALEKKMAALIYHVSGGKQEPKKEML